MPKTAQPNQQSHPAKGATLGFLLRAAYALLQERVYADVAAAGHPELRPVHSTILRHLPPEGGRVSDIARASGLAKQSVAYIAEDLVSLGYLRSDPDPLDGRARRMSYTARGHKLLKALMDASSSAEAALATSLGKTQVRSLRKILEAILSEQP